MKGILRFLPKTWTSDLVEKPTTVTTTTVVDHDPSKLTVDTAYQTRWIWYHTILALELLVIIIILTGILVTIGIKL